MDNSITASKIKSLMLNSYRRFSKGEISETTAYRENTMLANILKAIEVSEAQERLEALENAINRTNEEE